MLGWILLLHALTSQLTRDASALSLTRSQVRKKSVKRLDKKTAMPTTFLSTSSASIHNNADDSKDQTYIPQAVQDSLKISGHKYYCSSCAVGFSKQRNYQEHMNGRKHQRVESERASAWQDFLEDAPSWNENISNDNSDNTTVLNVHTSWRDSEFAHFPHRLSCIDPSFTLDRISPQLRARFWRYLRDSFGQHYPELASIFHHVSLSAPRYLRVKELFETLEAFKIASSIIIMAQDSANNNQQDDRSSRKLDIATIDTIYDLACGHGLLGILLAYRFPTKKIVCIDLEARNSFEAFRSAFNEMGDSYEHQLTPLSNLEYREADLLSVQSELQLNATNRSFLIALHACNEANKEVVDMAKKGGAVWAVMPCCIRSKLYLRGASVLDLDSESRYNLLCGAFAEANDAQLVRTISRHITARPIVIAGGIFPNKPSSLTSTSGIKATTEKVRPLKKGTRGTMPPL